MSLKTFLTKKKSSASSIQEPKEGDAPSAPPSPETSSPPDTAKIQKLGMKLITLCKDRGENVNDVFDSMVNNYEAGDSSAEVSKPPAVSPPANTIAALDGIGQTFSALSDTFNAMEDLKKSLASTIVGPEEVMEEPGLLEQLGEIGVGPEQIQAVLSNLGQQKKPEVMGGKKYHG